MIITALPCQWHGETVANRCQRLADRAGAVGSRLMNIARSHPSRSAVSRHYAERAHAALQRGYQLSNYAHALRHQFS